MTIIFYDSPSSKQRWQVLSEIYAFKTDKLISYDYTRKHCGTGNFTLVIVLDERYIQKIMINGLIYIDGDWLIIRNVQYDDSKITITGTDLNGWLDQRITTIGTQEIAGTKGYDVVTGTTLDCLRHYINANAVQPTDANRRIPHLMVGENNGIFGNLHDSYMVRLKPLSEVVINMCNNVGLGYRIEHLHIGDIEADDEQFDNFVFKLALSNNHTVHQTQEPPLRAVVLSIKDNNTSSITFDKGNSNLINVAYATAKDMTTLVKRNGTEPSGCERYENAVDVSVDRLEDVEAYALEQIADNIETNSCEIDISTDVGYGTKYVLGDIISVKNHITGDFYDKQITAVEKIISDTENRIKLVLGDVNTKLLNKIEDNAQKSLKSEIGRVEQKILTVDDKITEVDNSVKELTPTNWITPTFYNNSTYWANNTESLNTNFKPVEYRKVGSQVFINGFFKSTVTSNDFKTTDKKTLFVLPVGYCPTKQIYFRLPMTGTNYAKAYITPSGAVGLDFTSAAPTTDLTTLWFDFNNVSFFVD